MHPIFLTPRQRQTKALTLEELDQVFSVSTSKHAAFQARQVPIWIRRNILREQGIPHEVLYPWERKEVEVARGFTEKIGKVA